MNVSTVFMLFYDPGFWKTCPI